MSFTGIINQINFSELEAEKYWTPPSSKSDKEKKEIAKNFIFSGDYLGAVKKDGAYYRFIKDENGEMVLQGRSRSVSGIFLNKIEWVPHLQAFFDWLPNGTCLLGEIYFPEKEGSHNVTTIMGCLKDKAIQRQKDNNFLSYYIFDLWAYNNESFLSTSMEKRVEKLKEIEEAWYKYRIKTNPLYKIEFATYYSGRNLWEVLQNTLSAGGEGVVITKADSVPAPGKRTARKTLKIKKEIQDTLDVIIIGVNPPTKEYTGKSVETWQYWYNEKKDERLQGDFYLESTKNGMIIPVTKNFFYKWAGSLKLGVLKDGKKIYIGNLSGMTEEVLSNWRDYIGNIAEITCMEIMNETQGFRHPKFVKWRPDLSQEDATYDKIFN